MLSVPEGEDRHFEYSIQCGAPSPHRVLMLQGPGTEAKCLSLVTHLGWAAYFGPWWHVERQQLSLKLLMCTVRRVNPGFGGPLSVCNSIYIIQFDLHIRSCVA